MTEQGVHSIAFPKLDDAQIAALGEFTALKSFNNEETLFAAGESDFKFFVVKTGKVAIVEHPLGRKNRYGTRGEGIHRRCRYVNG